MKKTMTLMLIAAICLTALTASAEDVIGTILGTRTTQAFTTEEVKSEDLTLILQAGCSAASAINQQPWFFSVVTNRDMMSEISGSFGGTPSGMPKGDGKAPEGAPAKEGSGMPGGMPGEMPDGMPGKTPDGMPGETPDGMPGGFDPSQGAPAGARMPEAGPGAGSGSVKAGVGDSPVAIVVWLDGSGMGTSAFDCGLACQNMVIAASALGYGTKIVSSPTMTLNGINHEELCAKLGTDPSLTAVAVLLIGKADDSLDAVTGATERAPIDEKVSFIE